MFFFRYRVPVLVCRLKRPMRLVEVRFEEGRRHGEDKFVSVEVLISNSDDDIRHLLIVYVRFKLLMFEFFWISR